MTNVRHPIHIFMIVILTIMLGGVFCLLAGWIGERNWLRQAGRLLLTIAFIVAWLPLLLSITLSVFKSKKQNVPPHE
jgi:4-amino-4-deoxy-L-arabinose transferase-like glycosyltransferase